MQSSDSAVLNLASLLQHSPGQPSEVSAEGLLTPAPELLEADGIRLKEPLRWRLTVMNAGGDDDFVLEGAVEGTVIMECRRCLTDVDTKVRTTFVYPMEYRPSDLPLVLDEDSKEGDDELLIFGSFAVEFSAFLTELVAIELPITAVCRPGCLGLDENGVNLNEHPELAPKRKPQVVTEGVSPFAALKDIDISA